jgi:hypothetical protein
MSRWDVTLNWGPDNGIKDDDDDGAATVIAAAIHELAEQRMAWADLARAALLLPQSAQVVQLAAKRVDPAQ